MPHRITKTEGIQFGIYYEIEFIINELSTLVLHLFLAEAFAMLKLRHTFFHLTSEIEADK
jgi:hypothetical protein